MKHRYCVVVCFVLIIIPIFYWIKCELGADFYESYSLSHYVPFSYLTRNDTIKPHDLGILLKDSFEPFGIRNEWLRLWTEDKGKVTQGYDSNGIEMSRCLFVRSASQKEWSYSQNRIVEVQKGDVFSYSIYIQLRGEEIRASASVDSFDKDKKVIQWGYITEQVEEMGTWVKIDKKFMINDDVNYIRFRLSGIGVGEYRFDDVCFRKE